MKSTTKNRPRKKKTVLVLRTCNADMTSHGGFVWPESGPVECNDWDPQPKCGNGLHGLLRGEGDGSLLSWDAGAKWLAVEVDESTVIDLVGKVKFPRGVVVCCGDRLTVTSYLRENGCLGAIAGATATAGNSGTATAGNSGTATAGYRGTATAGYMGTATAGYRGTAMAGDWGTATAGDSGTATAGDGGTATAGDGGTATAGYRGTAMAGDGGTAMAGDGGTAMAGDWGTAMAGDGGIIAVKRWCGKRYRLVVGYVGENGIKPGVKYRAKKDSDELEDAIA